MAQELKRICHNCRADTTYVTKTGLAQWYHDKNGNLLCSKCRMKLVTNKKWHPITNPKRPKELLRKYNLRNYPIHGEVKKDLRRIPESNSAQIELKKEYNAVRVKEIREGNAPPKKDTLRRCIHKVKQGFPSWKPEYDKEWFEQ